MVNLRGMRMGRSAHPIPPAAVADEVELYAREWGRHGKLEWNPHARCWLVRFSLMPNDPRNLLMQTQQVEQTEDVWLMEPHPERGKRLANGQRIGPYRSLDIEQLGPSGVRAFLERTNTWSGRGEFGSLGEAVKKNADDVRDHKRKVREDAREGARDLARDVRRQVNKIPLITTGIDLKESS